MTIARHTLSNLQSQPAAPTNFAVDTHVHILRKGTQLTSERHSEPADDATVDDLVTNLDRVGLSHALVTAPSFYGTNNRLLLDALASAPDRLLGTVALDPKWEADDFEKLWHQGVRGVRFNLLSTPRLPDFSSGEIAEHIEAIGQAGLHVEVLIEESRLGELALVPLIEHAHVVFDHFAMVSDPLSRTANLVRDLLTSNRCWVKLSAPFRPGASDHSLREWSESLLEIAPTRLLWGSDWPWVSHESAGYDYPSVAGWLSRWVVDPNARAQILSTNPRQLLSPI